MAARGTEKRLIELQELVHADPFSEAAQAALVKALKSKVGILVARAVGYLDRFGIYGHEKAFAPALSRFLALPAKFDPSCTAKVALVDAMRVMGGADADLLRKALRHTQVEPVYRPPDSYSADTAGGLRGAAAIALVDAAPIGVLYDLVDLLADPEPQARLLAARAIAASGEPGAEVVLRLKAHAGDSRSEVTATVFAALVQVWPERNIELVGRFLHHDDEVTVENAALALADTRDGRAFPLLRAYLDGDVDRRIGYLALAMLRLEVATEFLLDTVATGLSSDAALAVEGLAIHAHDERMKARVKRLVEIRGVREISDAFRALY